MISIVTPIGDFGTTLADVERMLAGVPDEEQIEIVINSPGGDAYEGLAIANYLKSRPNRVVARIVGLAASAASLIALAADEVVMMPGSALMIHEPFTIASGTADDLREAAELLEEINDRLVEFYMQVWKGSEEDLREAVENETYFGPEDAAEKFKNVRAESSEEEDPEKVYAMKVGKVFAMNHGEKLQQILFNVKNLKKMAHNSVDKKISEESDIDFVEVELIRQGTALGFSKKFCLKLKDQVSCGLSVQPRFETLMKVKKLLAQASKVREFSAEECEEILLSCKTVEQGREKILAMIAEESGPEIRTEVVQPPSAATIQNIPQRISHDEIMSLWNKK
jgi:ATP-dependent protease ClpP protease subunit